MSKPNTKIVKITCENENAARALFSVLQIGATELCRDIKKSYAVAGKGDSDPTFEDIDGAKLSFKLSVKPVNKGDVMVMNENSMPTLASYEDVEDEELYVIIESGKTIMFQRKKEESSVDRVLGSIINAAHMVEAFTQIPADLKAEKEAKDKAELEKEAPTEEERRDQMKVNK